MGILEMSIEAESWRLVLISSRVLSMVERFCKPRKSNLTAPWSSAYFIGYIDCSTPSFPVQTGITSRISWSMIITPAAWVPKWVFRSSSCRLNLIKRCSFSLPSAASSASSGTLASAWSSVIFKSFGTSFAILSASEYGKSSTRATPRTTAFALSEPKVDIWHTFLSPYFSRTCSITFSLPSTSKSISKSGRFTRYGLRNLSNSSP